ncbi:MAG: type-F conjugative transfer system pilin assembly protein TrbC [Rhodocyclaceae bacterium]|nr:type-F conjugative transfer system pilin assembly protein TrbC [Rhodocyclaceae bacterium]
MTSTPKALAHAVLAAITACALAMPRAHAEPSATQSSPGQDVRAHNRAVLDAAAATAAGGRPVRALPEVSDLPLPAGPADPAEVAKRYVAVAPAIANAPALYVLISLSVPTASLQSIAADAARAGAVMVLRGTRKDAAPLSLRATLAALEPLSSTGATVQIHPQMFQRFGIDAVPAFVLTTTASEQCEASGGTCAPFYSVAGDVPLRHALEHVAQASPQAEALARPFLARLPVQ